MNKIGLLLSTMHDAETDLADDYRKVGERHAADHDVWHLTHQFAEQCTARAKRLRAISERFEKSLDAPDSVPLLDSVLANLRRAMSELSGGRPEVALLLLRDLRQLYVAAEEVSLYWIMLGQVAQALRERDLLAQVDELHREVLSQVKWIKTKVKEATPQVLVAGA